MPVTALVVTLEDASRAHDFLRAVRADARLEAGPPSDCHVPLVVETSTAAEGRSLAEGLESFEGVVRVALVSVNFEDSQG